MTKPTYPSDKQDQYMVRFPDGMREKLKEEAELKGRSLNAEIIYRLQNSFQIEDAVRKAEWGEFYMKRDLDRIMRLFIQLTPEERRLLEERAEIFEKAEIYGLKSENIGKWTELHPIGKKGRIVFTKPPIDYEPLLIRYPGDDEQP